MRDKQLLRFSFIVILLITSITGCASTKQQPVTITIQMFEGPEYDAMVPTVDYWNTTYATETGITVEVSALDRTGYFGKLETQLVAGMATPDIVHPFSLHLGRLQPYLEPLNSYFENEMIMTAPGGEQLSLDVVLEPALQTVTTPDGNIYMVPKDMSELILYYRKDLMEDPPSTWEAFVELAKTYTKGLNPESPTEYGAILKGKYEMWTFCSALEIIWPYGGNIFMPGTTTSGFDSPGTVAAFQIYENLTQSRAMPPEAVNAEYFEVANAVQTNQVAMAIQWNAFYHTLMDKDASPDAWDKYDIAPPPGVQQPDGSIKRTLYVQTIGLALNKNSEHKEAAMKFLAWAALGEGALMYADACGSSPISTVWKAADANPLYQKITPWVEGFGRSTPMHEDITDIIMVGSSWVQRVMSESATAEEAAQGLNEEVTALLNP